MPDSFPAKLLLFGEYTVLDGSQALAVPLQKWTGKWNKKDENTQMSLVPEYYRWLSKVELIDEETYNWIVRDYEEGLSYDADIPIGYGVGSSGAYVAAVYDRYLRSGESDIQKCCEIMSRMESYFHGSSSGMDPLVSYSGKAVHKNEKGILQPFDDKGWPEGYKTYLLDSGMVRETSSLVNRYKERTEDHKTSRKIKRQIVPMVDHAIKHYLESNSKKLEQDLGEISTFQREHFEEIIPDNVKGQWDDLVSQPGVYVKLCGAGGGGYFLVISSSPEDLQGKELINIH